MFRFIWELLWLDNAPLQSPSFITDTGRLFAYHLTTHDDSYWAELSPFSSLHTNQPPQLYFSFLLTYFTHTVRIWTETHILSLYSSILFKIIQWPQLWNSQPKDPIQADDASFQFFLQWLLILDLWGRYISILKCNWFDVEFQIFHNTLF